MGDRTHAAKKNPPTRARDRPPRLSFAWRRYPWYAEGHWYRCPHCRLGCDYYETEEFNHRRCTANYADWKPYLEHMAMARPPMRKPTAPPRGTVTNEKWKDAEFEADYPFLFAFLHETKWDDGTQRQTGTMTLFVQDGVLKAVVNDRALERSGFVSGSTLSLLFDALESNLSEDTMDWREKGYGSHK